MIVTPAWLSENLEAHSTVLLTGGFDPLHYGHVRYFQQAANIGLPIVVGVAPDSYIVKKHPILQPIEHRMETIDAIRWVTYVADQNDESAATLIRAVRPRFFIKGDIWLKRGLPKIEQIAMNDVGTEIKYINVHPVKSTDLLHKFAWDFM